MIQDDKKDALERRKPSSGFFVLLILGLVVLIFHFQGNTTDVRLFSKSLFKWMIIRWSDATISLGTYSHGWLIPIVSVVAIWFRRKELLVAEEKVCWRGLWVIVFALVLHLLGARAQQPRISLVGFVILIWAIPLFLQGWQVARLLIFPCAYLIFCIPLNFLDELSFYLRVIVTKTSVILLNGLGIATENVGTAIFSSAGGGFSLDVADPCSGIRSLLAITALAAAYAYFSQSILWKKWILFLLSIPLAVIGNIVRVLTIGVLAYFCGQKTAVNFYHDFSGYLVMIVVILLLMWLGDMLEGKSKKRKASGKE
ncbi:MAG: exosortase/archaeosortase family protein [Kiritimatiellae bacterium]|nr:exosortase/archaeosortase family protein [Kiritimatiellia bacterium]MDD5523068.1 exosortase/archaeosortase family protein [Kiritimatiellia bacterium]